jgi:hypothetical protein
MNAYAHEDEEEFGDATKSWGATGANVRDPLARKEWEGAAVPNTTFGLCEVT